MDISVLERAWQEQAVTGGGETAGAVAARMKREVAVAQRRIRGGIALAALVLFTGWVVTAVAHFTSIKRVTPIAFGADVVYLVLFVAFFVRAQQSARAVGNEIAMMGGTLPESAAATLRTVELEIQNARIAAYAIPGVVGMSAWLYLARYLAGDIAGIPAVVGSVAVAGIGVIIGTAFWYRWRTRLTPRREELTELLRALEDERNAAI